MLRKAITIFFALLLMRFIAAKKNKVLVVAEFGKSGGTRTYFIYLLHFLKAQGYNISVLWNGAKNEDEEMRQLLESYNCTLLPANFDFWSVNMNEIPAGLSKSNMVNYQLNELQFWLRLQGQHRFSSIILSVAYPEKYLYVFLLPTQITYVLHTAVVKKADKWKQYLLNGCLNSKKRILTVSRFAKQSIIRNWLSNKDSRFVEFIYNYYSPILSDTYQATEVKKVKKVLTIGHVESYKNPLLFVETAKAVISCNNGDAIEFVWAGDGSMLDACKHASANYPQIKFIGDVKNVERLYKEATLYYQPSLLESHGIATLGAMYHGLPCVVSEHGGLKESVVDGENGYVIDVNNSDESVKKINTLLYDKELREAMGENGQIRFQSTFSRDVWYNKMKLFFNN